MASSTESVVRLRFFSVLREAIGSTTIDLAVDENGWPVSAVEDWVVRRNPIAESWRGVWRIAINQRYVEEGAVVKPGDEVAFITPVSGG